MPEKRGFPWALLIGALVAALFIFLATIIIRHANESRANIPVQGEVPDFDFTTQHGESFTKAEFLGKISIVDFVFTRCQGACPVMNKSMRPLYKLYDGEDQIQFVSISVDPDYDTQQVLYEYAIRQGVTDRRWLFLRGPIEEVVRVSEKGFLLPADQLPMGHSTKFVLVDQKGQIRGYYDSYSETSMKNLRMHIRELYKEGQE